MKANDLLERQHKVIRKLFSRFADANDAARLALFDEIGVHLMSHAVIEREIFYPACEAALRRRGDDHGDVLGVARVGHELLQFCLQRADEERNDRHFVAYVRALERSFKAHIDEEEDGLLRDAKRDMGAASIEELGTQMEQRLDQLLRQDFRTLLRAPARARDGAAKNGKPAKPAQRKKATGSKPRGAPARSR